MSEPRRTIMEMDVAHSRGVNWRAIPYIISIFLSLLGLVLYFTLNNEPLASTSVIETDHLVVRVLGDSRLPLKEAASRLEADYSGLLTKLQIPQTEKMFIDIYPDRMSFDKAHSSPAFEFPEVPVSMSEFRLSIITPASQNTVYDMDSIYKVTKHEWTHFLANYLQPSPDVKWLRESMAMYYGGQTNDSKIVKSVLKKGYPTIDELNDNRYKDLYSIGYTLSEFIADKWGEDSLVELLAFNGNIQLVLKVSKEDFEEEWYQFIEQKYVK